MDKETGQRYELTTKNGIAEMFHFRFFPLMPQDYVAVRRVPCLCKPCYDTLDKKWDMKEKDPKKQPIFAKTVGCYFEDHMSGGLNDWNLVKMSARMEDLSLIQI